MKQRIIILLFSSILHLSSLGQKLVNSKFSPCDSGNPLMGRMQTTLNRISNLGDSLLIDITWIDNCGFDPVFSLKGVVGDTIHINYKNKLEDEPAFCGCAFKLQFTISKLKTSTYEIKIGDIWII